MTAKELKRFPQPVIGTIFHSSNLRAWCVSYHLILLAPQDLGTIILILHERKLGLETLAPHHNSKVLKLRFELSHVTEELRLFFLCLCAFIYLF